MIVGFTAAAAAGNARPVVCTTCGDGGGFPTLYLAIYSGYAAPLTGASYPNLNDLWAGYRINPSQEKNHSTTDPMYDDYHFATRCRYDDSSQGHVAFFPSDDNGVHPNDDAGAFYWYDDLAPGAPANHSSDSTAVNRCSTVAANHGSIIDAVFTTHDCSGTWCNKTNWNPGIAGVSVGEFFPELYTSAVSNSLTLYNEWMSHSGSQTLNHTNSAGTIDITWYVNNSAATPGVILGQLTSADATAVQTRVANLCAASLNSAGWSFSVYSNASIAGADDGSPSFSRSKDAEAAIVRGMADCTT